MPVTMRDVAERAGVSIKTVSRVVNEQGEISEATRQNVLAVIKELRYRPNLLARGLVTQRTNTIGLVIGDITNPFFSEVARGVQDVARAEGYNIFLANTDSLPDDERKVLRSLADHAVDGIIIFPNSDNEELIGELASREQPIVLVNYLLNHEHVGLVTTDLYAGSRLAVDHLAAKGHQHIGMLAGSNLVVGNNQGRRLRGFRDGLAAYGLPDNPDYVRISPGNMEGGHAAALALLAQHPQITAIYAYNDLLAMGALQACRQMGKRVPDECALIGFDDILMVSLVNPSLTSVRIDKSNLGQQAMHQLLSMIRNPDQPPAPIVLGVDLVIREST
ncbi:MAG: LacI family DNA-binding transcriptional regulator [Caldilineaceae bacterium]|nr:LacI family DNA-binding transcriptional regulator [Caldilineaceae bacterium]MBP8108260.1 LacI family DNA-binding transcriptional regulator [Caldilineaceae bacterium]MBP8121649.1 LacI family DNA-binding transcriptional regulator [Caldilineaceae bacterium]MBP9071651.1 LacI family DNA-binding transcriptional regulator [Caldilineaceae bacterium]